jgi:hypothetical protein
MFCGDALITALLLVTVCSKLSDADSEPSHRCTCPIATPCLIGVLYTNIRMVYLCDLWRLNPEDRMSDWSYYFMGDADV